MTDKSVLVAADADLRARLRELLREVGEIDVVAEAEDGAEGIRVLNEVDPDIAFISMDLPDMKAVDVVRRLVHDPAVVFLAADDRRTAAAFEVGAVDYVLVPFGRERLAEAVRRAREQGTKESGRGAARADTDAAEQTPALLRRLFLKERDGIVPLPIVRIARFEADGDYVVVHAAQRRHLVRIRLRDLEAEVGERFLRVHRAHLVNLDHVRIFENHEDGRLVVVMDDGTRIVASRARSRELRRRAL